jgi:hypothetical protein
MNTKIEVKPALSAEEWAQIPRSLHGSGVLVIDSIDGMRLRQTDTLARIMALANAALPVDHPQKLTWEMVDALRESARVHQDEYGFDKRPKHVAQRALGLAAIDGIAALLPPREVKT